MYNPDKGCALRKNCQQYELKFRIKLVKYCQSALAFNSYA